CDERTLPGFRHLQFEARHTTGVGLRKVIKRGLAHPLGVLRGAMASESTPSASARAMAPTNLRSFRELITGTLRCSLVSRTGSASSSFWFGVRHDGGGRITSNAITPLDRKSVV